MSKIHSMGLGALGGLVFMLALLLPLAVPEGAFADAGSDCNTQCQTSCAAQCNGDPACMSVCMGQCGYECCNTQCLGDFTCVDGCCQAVCGGDPVCMTNCKAPAPLPKRCAPTKCASRASCQIQFAPDCTINCGGLNNTCPGCACQPLEENCDCQQIKGP